MRRARLLPLAGGRRHRRGRRELAEHGRHGLFAAVAQQTDGDLLAGRQQADRAAQRAGVAEPRAVDADDDVFDLNAGTLGGGVLSRLP